MRFSTRTISTLPFIAKAFVLAMLLQGVALSKVHADQIPMPVASEALRVKPYYSSPESFAVSSTLIEGNKEVVLIDAQFTLSEGKKVADLIAASKKKLVAIFITHAHPDHSWGVEKILERFPDAPVYSTQTIIDELTTLNPKKLAVWKPMLGKAITDAPRMPKPYKQSFFQLEDHPIEIISLKAADSKNAIAFWVPSAKTLVAGDAVFDDAHVWLADADAKHRKTWLASLDKLKALNPEKVIPGHRGPHATENTEAILKTAEYIKDFDKTLAEATSPDDVMLLMNAKHQTLGLPMILQYSAQAWGKKPKYIGKTIRVSNPHGDIFDVTFDDANKLHWIAVEGPMKGKQGQSDFHAHEASPNVWYLNWVEKDGTVMSQLIDWNKKTVFAFAANPGLAKKEKVASPMEMYQKSRFEELKPVAGTK